MIIQYIVLYTLIRCNLKLFKKLESSFSADVAPMVAICTGTNCAYAAM